MNESLRGSPEPRQVALEFSPVEVAARWRDRRGLVFFDSADGLGWSFLACEPVRVMEGGAETDWSALSAEIGAREIGSAWDQPIPAGFAAGWVEYDGLFCFGIYESLLAYDHTSGDWWAVGMPPGVEDVPAVPKSEAPVFEALLPEAAFREMVTRAQEYIAAGDIYQVNLSHRILARWSGDPFTFYEALRNYSPAPHAAFMNFGRRKVLSSSPELFLHASDRSVRTRPIKGTRPRSADPMADERSALELLTSPKELAELVMITDLERNDLGRVCEFGSVRVSELLRLERFEQVFHLVSTVEGQLREGVGHVAALRACFPGGSITGAPKKRAMEIIAELEPESRGLYTGAIGYFGFNGESQFNIAIRTVIADEDSLHFHVGAGIVADSDAEAEYQETLQKAAGILLAAERM